MWKTNTIAIFVKELRPDREADLLSLLSPRVNLTSAGRGPTRQELWAAKPVKHSI